jgi:hypothetical protein
VAVSVERARPPLARLACQRADVSRARERREHTRTCSASARERLVGAVEANEEIDQGARARLPVGEKTFLTLPHRHAEHGLVEAALGSDVRKDGGLGRPGALQRFGTAVGPSPSLDLKERGGSDPLLRGKRVARDGESALGERDPPVDLGERGREVRVRQGRIRACLRERCLRARWLAAPDERQSGVGLRHRREGAVAAGAREHRRLFERRKRVAHVAGHAGLRGEQAALADVDLEDGAEARRRVRWLLRGQLLEAGERLPPATEVLELHCVFHARFPGRVGVREALRSGARLVEEAQRASPVAACERRYAPVIEAVRGALLVACEGVARGVEHAQRGRRVVAAGR